MFGVAASVVTKALRGAGQGLDRLGRMFEVNPYVDGLLPTTRAVAYKKSQPSITGAAFVAPSATIVGDVTLGQGASVWYGAVVRGDGGTVTIGRGVSVGDRALISGGSPLKKNNTIIGDNVTIGAGAVILGCTLESGCVIGEGAQVLDGSKVASKAMIAPGAVLPSGKVVTVGQLWAGSPALYVRDLTTAEVASLSALAAENTQLAADHALECAKNWAQIEYDEMEHEQITERNEYYYSRLTPEEMSKREGELNNHMAPGRILNSPSKRSPHKFFFSYYTHSILTFVVSARK